MLDLDHLLYEIDKVEQEMAAQMEGGDLEMVELLDGRRRNLVADLCSRPVAEPQVRQAVEQLIIHYRAEINRLNEVREETRRLILKARQSSRFLNAYNGGHTPYGSGNRGGYGRR